jgi:hypothetical protein
MSDGALGERIVLANEFTEVWVQKVRTRNGERLRIFSPRLGFQIDLLPLLGNPFRPGCGNAGSASFGSVAVGRR